MEPFALYLQAEVFAGLAKLRRSERARWLRHFELLSRDPGCAHDFTEVIGGREMSVKLIDQYAVTYWVDHPVREIKIVSLRNAD